MSAEIAIDARDLAGCFRSSGTPKDNYFNYVLIFALYVLDWVISERILVGPLVMWIPCLKKIFTLVLYVRHYIIE
jgi:hypothetical protein